MLLAGGAAMLAGCSGTSAPTSPAPTPSSGTTSTGTTSSGTTSSGASGAFTIEQVATYAEPWAMTFLPGTEYAAITERGGRLVVRDLGAGTDLDVAGVPQVRAQGQGGLGDIIAAPSFDHDQRVFLSWVEAGDGATAGAVVGAGRLVIDGDGARLENLNVIWRQEPKVDGSGHFSHRLAVSPDGQHLFVSSGDRQQMTPAQELTNDLGKILRLNLDGSPAAGNPFADQGYPASEIWSYGHRNPLGLAFDADGRLWSSEMGPKGGDEINLIESGANYGWPKASNGSHYDGTEIPDHTAGDGYAAPKLSWNPSISPGSLMIYTGDAFPQWRGDAFVGALSGTSLLRIDLDGKSAVAGDRFDDGPLGTRIREVEQAPDGTIWVLQDGADGALLHLSPA
jgi:glucose/arabinose dehydrogenase